MKKGWFAPRQACAGGGTYQAFAPGDVARLQAIGTLREAGFSIAQMQAMLQRPGDTWAIAQAHRRALMEDSQKNRELGGRLASLGPGDAAGLDRLAAFLQEEPGRAVAAPVAGAPGFGRFDEENPDEKSSRLEAFRREQQQDFRRGKRAMGMIVAYYLVSLAIGAFVDFSWLRVIIGLVWAVLLMRGYPWVRVVFAACIAAGAALDAVGLVALLEDPPIPWLASHTAFALCVAVDIVCRAGISIALFKSRAIRE
nr:hypothetical protein [bacterium]